MPPLATAIVAVLKSSSPLIRARLHHHGLHAGQVVHVGEVDLVHALLGLREVGNHDVDDTLLQHRDARARNDLPELDVPRIAEERAGDLLGHVDLEALHRPVFGFW